VALRPLLAAQLLPPGPQDPAQAQDRRQLSAWLDLLGSLDRGALEEGCWQAVFGAVLFLSALRAFDLGYLRVGGPGG
jgi:hypothetical protein